MRKSVFGLVIAALLGGIILSVILINESEPILSKDQPEPTSTEPRIKLPWDGGVTPITEWYVETDYLGGLIGRTI